jgi:hypothetical protein
VLGHIGHLGGAVCGGVARHGDVGHISQAQAGVTQQTSDGVGREGRCVLLAIAKAFFSNRAK